VIIVDDGSSDHTPQLMKDLMAQHSFLRYVRHEKNRGYGGALRSGFEESKGKLVFFSDGDNQFRLNELTEFLNILKSENADAVIGFRKNRQDHLVRKLNTFLWGSLVKFLLKVKAKDIDCAYKLFKKDCLQGIEFKSNGAMISTELLFFLYKKQYKILQLPVTHYPRTQGNPTGAKLSVILRAFRELFLFYWKNR
jgi:glycosyltransferase involved in cell wall biosynthesis